MIQAALPCCLVVGLALLLLLPVPAARADEAPSHAPADIVDTAVAAGSFQTLVAALKAAGLVDALRGEGPFTVFAPTDAAFAALPEGTVEGLLQPESRAALERLLRFHVVSGRVTSKDLLPVREARTLAGATVGLGLRVGDSTVVQADIACSNGVIHVIDGVLTPPPVERDRMPSVDVAATIHEAIGRGVPIYNGGDPAGCAKVYAEAATHLVEDAGAELSALARDDLERALANHESHADRAWALRHAFDRTLADMAFEPRREAPMPEGFPEPGPVGRIVRKSYPVYRAARTEGGNSFWTLFQHIKSNDVEMTAPVEMTMGKDMRPEAMAFLYENARQGSSGTAGRVAVLDRMPADVLSIGMRGDRGAERVALARRLIEARLEADGLEVAGSWRVMGYNSPMVPRDQQFWELQVPVRSTRR